MGTTARQTGLKLSGTANVLDYGAKGDGTTDDTAAFNAALAAAPNVRYPGFLRSGAIAQYKIAGQVSIPMGHALTGPNMGPTSTPNNKYYGTSFNPPTGFAAGFQTVAPATIPGLLLITGNAGTTGTPTNPFATAAFLLTTNSVFENFCMYWPNQALVGTGAPTAYPYAIGMTWGVNATVRNGGLINPYQGINIYGMWRPTVENIVGQPYYKGIRVDQCYDCARISNVHFECFWDAVVSPPASQGFNSTWSLANGTGFEFYRCDLANLVNSFVYGMNTGLLCASSSGTGSSLDGTASNAPWLVCTDFGADGCNTSVLIQSTQVPFGASFNGGTIDALTGNALQVTGGLGVFNSVLVLVGNASVTGGEARFLGCSFAGSANITGGKVQFNANTFNATSGQLTLGASVAKALVANNAFTTAVGITNNIASSTNYTIANNQAW